MSCFFKADFNDKIDEYLILNSKKRTEILDYKNFKQALNY